MIRIQEALAIVIWLGGAAIRFNHFSERFSAFDDGPTVILSNVVWTLYRSILIGGASLNKGCVLALASTKIYIYADFEEQKHLQQHHQIGRKKPARSYRPFSAFQVNSYIVLFTIPQWALEL